MKIFLDTEFTHLDQSADLISIGLVTETDKTFYAEFSDFSPEKCSEFTQTYVLSELLFPHVKGEYYYSSHGNIEVKSNTPQIVKYLGQWLREQRTSPEKYYVWGDCIAYDWVLFCQLFGGAQKIPSCIYYIPFDICTLFETVGANPDTHRESFANMQASKQKHNALWDARVIKACYEKLS